MSPTERTREDARLYTIPEVAMHFARQHPHREGVECEADIYDRLTDDLLKAVESGALAAIDARSWRARTPWTRPMAEAGFLLQGVFLQAAQVDDLMSQRGAGLAPLAGGPAPAPREPSKDDGLTVPVYLAVKAAHNAGRRRPTARELLNLWRHDKPPEVFEVMPGEVKFWDSRGDLKTVNIEALQGRIKRAAGR